MESSNYYYIIQEFCDGGELRQFMKKKGRIPEKDAIILLMQICNGFVELILAIWNDHSIREAYDRRREFPKYFVENIPYFIENIDRIGSRVKLKTLIYAENFYFIKLSKQVLKDFLL